MTQMTNMPSLNHEGRRLPKQKPGQSDQSYQTPISLLEAIKVNVQIKGFDIDLAASPENTVCSKYFTEEDNALMQNWKVGDGWNYCNPPFSDIEPWVAKAYYEAMTNGAQTIVLVPASVGSNWWAKFVHEKAMVYFMNGRITFVGAKDPYPKDTALLFYSPNSPYSHADCYNIWTFKQPRTPYRSHTT